MPIDPRDYERLLYGTRSKKTRRMRNIRWVMALIAVAIIDLGLLAADSASRNTSVENASRSGVRSNAVLRVPTLRTGDTSSGTRRLARAEL
ncbi:hypothetical protein [Burkholderia sp. 4NA327B6]|uniref:hypothetical protein n=1 Tax=Burkholderia sp. 4NA327B6 TaxID=2502225 RepID=UPI0014872323|nr:hypothetical protein [Burkholderia sp. 4NA327B6]